MSLQTQPHKNAIDFHIDAVNRRWYARACNLWTLSDSTYNCFPRVYRNNLENGSGYIPEFFSPEMQKYVAGDLKSVKGGMFFEDKLAAISYFHLVDSVKHSDSNGDYIANLQMLFFLDLSKITPGGITDAEGQRLDDVAIADFENFMLSNGCGFQITNVFRGVDKVLEAFSGEQKRNTLTRDMHPRLCFRVDLRLPYNPNLHTPESANPVIEMTEYRSLVLFIKTTPNPANKIAVGNGKFIQAEYAPGNTLTPMLAGAGNGYLAGRTVQYPFTYNNNSDTVPTYSTTYGTWDRTAFATGDYLGFNDGDIVVIPFKDTY